MIELTIVSEEIAAAGCPLLLIVVSPAIAATVIATSGTAEQKERWLPGFADGSLKMRLRDHRAGRGLELAQDHNDRARDPDGAWLAALRPQVLHLRGRRDRRDARRRPARRLADRHAPAGDVPRAYRCPGDELPPDRHGDHLPEQQFALFFDDARCPTTRSSAARRPGSPRCSPG